MIFAHKKPISIERVQTFAIPWIPFADQSENRQQQFLDWIINFCCIFGGKEIIIISKEF